MRGGIKSASAVYLYLIVRSSHKLDDCQDQTRPSNLCWDRTPSAKKRSRFNALLLILGFHALNAS